MTKSCRCEKCRMMCRYKPGWFKPDEIKPAAEAMGMTQRKFFDRYLAVDWWEGSPTIYVIAPNITTNLGADMYPSRPLGQCCLLDENGRCMIYGAHPWECQAASHKHDRAHGQQLHREAAEAWDNPKAKALVKRLLTHEPSAPWPHEPEPTSILDSLFW